ncbi:hypothetical protein [Catellatospora tritici]|uniref:hypothetical protein n=1 Tax=Catellatospora tritici TaxID=2851566 RepID=UPI001C2CDA45|nr:hypothetical protein [Catellatospora tritici]MBV1849319.1 hypothetical protein [Catellatospora tritici]
MDKDTFTSRFRQAAEMAHRFAQTMISEPLPDALSFRVRLNQSYDGHPPRPGEVRFPEDSSWEKASSLHRVDLATAVAQLWRDGRVPEWINVMVTSETGTETVFEVVCCGRFTGDDEHLYHEREGMPPFHALGPWLPPRRHEGTFSIHTRAECWDATDLRALAAAADSVWSLDLCTAEFDGQLLSALPELPNLEIFEHRRCRLGTGALSTFARFPRLKRLTLHLADAEGFSAAGGALTTVTDLTIANLPPRPWGCESLATQAPAVESLTLVGTDTVWLGGVISERVRQLTIGGGSLAGSVRLPRELDSLSISVDGDGDLPLHRLLDGVERLGSLSLRGTPVDDDTVVDLVRRHTPDDIDLVGTAVSAQTMSQLRATYPDMEVLPRSLGAATLPA